MTPPAAQTQDLYVRNGAAVSIKPATADGEAAILEFLGDVALAPGRAVVGRRNTHMDRMENQQMLAVFRAGFADQDQVDVEFATWSGRDAGARFQP